MKRWLLVPGGANGVARVSVAGELVVVTALARGDASLVVVDAAGVKTSWQVRVR